jgi:hypothetical protein
MEYDLNSKCLAVNSIAHAAIAADTDGDTIDSKGYESLMYVVQVNTALAGGGFDVKCEQAPDNAGSPGTWADVPDVDVVGGNTASPPVISLIATDADDVYRIGSIGKERFQRLVLTETGTVSGGTIGAIGILSDPVAIPVADQNT